MSRISVNELKENILYDSNDSTFRQLPMGTIIELIPDETLLIITDCNHRHEGKSAVACCLHTGRILSNNDDYYRYKIIKLRR